MAKNVASGFLEAATRSLRQAGAPKRRLRALEFLQTRLKQRDESATRRDDDPGVGSDDENRSVTKH